MATHSMNFPQTGIVRHPWKRPGAPLFVFAGLLLKRYFLRIILGDDGALAQPSPRAFKADL